MEKLSFLEYFIPLAELVFFYCLLLFLRGAVRRGITNCATPSTSAHTHAHLLQTTPQSSSSPPPSRLPHTLAHASLPETMVGGRNHKITFFLSWGRVLLFSNFIYTNRYRLVMVTRHIHSGNYRGVSYKTRQQNFCTLAFVSAAIKAPIWETCL